MGKDRVEDDARILKEWYQKQPHLPKDINDDYFLTFAGGCKSVEIAKKKIDTFFCSRNNEIWFKEFDSLFEKFRNEEGGEWSFLPGVTKEGWRVLMGSYSKYDINKVDARLELFRRMLSIELAIKLWPRDTSLAIILDLKDGSFGYLTTLDYSAEHTAMCYTKSAMPYRLKKIVILNPNAIVEKTCHIFMPFLGKKISDRLDFCTNVEKLKEFLPMEMLPKDYGGEAGTVVELGALWRKEMLAHEDWFRENARLRADMSKRPKDEGLDLGAGTFRSLKID